MKKLLAVPVALAFVFSAAGVVSAEDPIPSGLKKQEDDKLSGALKTSGDKNKKSDDKAKTSTGTRKDDRGDLRQRHQEVDREGAQGERPGRSPGRR